MKSLKPYIIYIIAIVLFIGFMILTYRLASINIENPVVDTGSFRQSLWDRWGVSIIIISFIILAGGIGILVLLGGDWRWE